MTYLVKQPLTKVQKLCSKSSYTATRCLGESFLQRAIAWLLISVGRG